LIKKKWFDQTSKIELETLLSLASNNLIKDVDTGFTETGLTSVDKLELTQNYIWVLFKLPINQQIEMRFVS
jgi:hypothetical protein